MDVVGPATPSKLLQTHRIAMGLVLAIAGTGLVGSCFGILALSSWHWSPATMAPLTSVSLILLVVASHCAIRDRFDCVTRASIAAGLSALLGFAVGDLAMFAGATSLPTMLVICCLALSLSLTPQTRTPVAPLVLGTFGGSLALALTTIVVLKPTALATIPGCAGLSLPTACSLLIVAGGIIAVLLRRGRTIQRPVNDTDLLYWFLPGLTVILVLVVLIVGLAGLEILDGTEAMWAGIATGLASATVIGAIMTRSVRRAVLVEGEQGRQLQQVFDVLDQSAIVAVTNTAGRIVHVNDLFCAISGYQRDELLGQTHRIVNSDHHPRSFFEEMWQTIRAGRIWTGEIRNRRKDGSCYWVDTRILPMVDAKGEIDRFIAVRFDITDRKRQEILLEQQREQLEAALAEQSTLNQSKNDLLRLLAHDLRGPATSAAGAAGLLARTVPDENFREVCEELALAADKQLALIDKLLDIERIRSGTIFGRSRTIDLPELIDRVIAHHRTEIDSRGMQVRRRMPDGMQVKTRPDVLERVLDNLLSNALKYTPEQGSIEIAGTLEPSGGFSLLVADSGPGIPSDKRDQVFRPFASIGTRVKNEDISTGLGLSLVASLVTEHLDGRISFEDSPLGGAAFRCRFPEHDLD